MRFGWPFAFSESEHLGRGSAEDVAQECARQSNSRGDTMRFVERVGRTLRGRASWTVVALVICGPSLVTAETVVARRRLGNNVEALTYDPINDRALAMDGNDVIAIALTPSDAAVLAALHENDG